ncbi:MAG: acyl-CoA synthetase [Gammaproteobacteria bacterium]|nr:acyl-CoA synthetase [Gammaproteobacteria bacterium]
MNKINLFNYGSVNEPVIYFRGNLVTLGELILLVESLLKNIPKHKFLLNLYEERFFFVVGLLMGIRQNNLSLFPSTISEFIFEYLSDNYTSILALSDEDIEADFITYKISEHCIEFLNSEVKNYDIAESLLQKYYSSLDLKKELAIIFTSGSTGFPKPYYKQLGDLLAANYLTDKLLEATRQTEKTKTLQALVATVPAQHMYGLEWSILFAFQHGLLMHSDKPFFPQDVSNCLQELAALRDYHTQITIITTPLHLKACVSNQVLLPHLKQFISATAFLDKSLVKQCSNFYQASILEIYGCTEVGSMAYRNRNSKQADLHWQTLEDISLEPMDNDVRVLTNRSIKQFLLHDNIKLIDAHNFHLEGRKEDIINLAGKRTSMAYLNHHLQSFEQFSDACYYEEKNGDLSRLIAFAVVKEGNDLSNQKKMNRKVKDYLKTKIEAVFLPKNIYYIDNLPRNATGKLPKSELKTLLSICRSS